jgi:hypothetical protein
MDKTLAAKIVPFLLESLIHGTTTQTGLRVSAHLLEGLFTTGKKVSDAVMKTLNMTRHAICPRWNYTIRPRFDPISTL